MNNSVLVLIFIIVVFIFGGLLYIYNPDPVKFTNPAEKPSVACTQEVMLCPDGTYVGRSGPNCEFESCTIPPNAIFEDGTLLEGEENHGDPVACTLEAKLCPDGSYVGRIGPNCEFAPCP